MKLLGREIFNEKVVDTLVISIVRFCIVSTIVGVWHISSKIETISYKIEYLERAHNETVQATKEDAESVRAEMLRNIAKRDETDREIRQSIDKLYNAVEKQNDRLNLLSDPKIHGELQPLPHIYANQDSNTNDDNHYTTLQDFMQPYSRDMK